MKKIYLISIILFFMGITSCNNNQKKQVNDTVQTTETCCDKDQMKKIIVAYKHIKPEKVDEFIEFAQELIVKSRAEEGNISYTLYQHPLEKGTFIFFEEWKNQAAIDYHFSTEHFKMGGDKGKEFEAAPTTLKIYDVVDTE